LPQTQAIAEVVPGYEAVNWYGVLAPAGTPAPILKKLHADIVATLRDPEVARTIENQGAAVVGNSPQEFTAYLRSEIEKWTRLIQSAGIRAN
jgi:tripartite-type tricarboxylate transporter receptor subunit TctC